MSEIIHLSAMDKLTIACVVRPKLGALCLSFAQLQCDDVDWLSAANRLLDIEAPSFVIDEWIDSISLSASAGYRTAVAHMILGDCGNVIASADEFRSYGDRYEEALNLRFRMTDEIALQQGTDTLASDHAHTKTD